MTNSEIPSQAEKQNPDSDPSQLDPEVLDKIKHPRSIHDQMKDLSPEEIRGNQAVTPEMLDEPSDEMTGFTRD
ncbi:MAG TPA: hypothetical protein DEV81_16675 [Cyanobacteria bacterium UBA11049]|nr:hypothetical protein [Cyanobacteria bacterium UBA11049]